MNTGSTREGFGGQGVHFTCTGSARQRSCSITSLVQCWAKVMLRNLLLCCIIPDESKHANSLLQPSLGSFCLSEGLHAFAHCDIHQLVM